MSYGELVSEFNDCVDRLNSGADLRMLIYLKSTLFDLKAQCHASQSSECRHLLSKIDRLLQGVVNQLEALLSSLKLSQLPDDRTLSWLERCDDAVYGLLSGAGLIEDRSHTMLDRFIAEYIEGRTDLKPRTVIKFNATRDYMLEHFGDCCSFRMRSNYQKATANIWFGVTEIGQAIFGLNYFE